MFKTPAVFVDIETNGSHGERGRIIEVAAIRVENGQIVDELQTLVNPGMQIPYWITNLTGITQNDLEHAPYFDEVAYQLSQILKDAVFVAHNVRFDYSFIKRQLETLGHEFKPKLFCTLRMSRFMYPEHQGHSLEKIINRHSIAVAGRHRAYDDAKAILDFTNLAVQEKGIDAFEQCLAKQFKTKTLPPNLHEADFAMVANNPGVYIFEDNSGLPLYVGKSINLRTRVLSHFAQDTKIAREMKLSQATHKLRTIETENELEALLLESQLIKELQPLYNKKLRRAYKQTLFKRTVNSDGYITIELENKDLAEVDDLSSVYGVYPSRMKAKLALENVLRTYQLCPKLLQLERTKNACFWRQLGKCRGACVGKEPAENYNQRVETALERSKISRWPYKSPIVVSLKKGRSIVIDQWIIKGYLEPVEGEESYFKKVINKFDLDTYKILRSYLKLNASNVGILPVNKL